MIHLEHLEKSFPRAGGREYVLRSISLDIRAGEFVSIMGPSGAGKSTLLHILGMHDAEWQGTYHFLDHDIRTMPTAARLSLQRTHIGFVFQQYHLLDDLTVAENLDLPLSYRDMKKGERQARVADTLDRFGIVGKKDLFPSQLSGGQQQLVGVARALIADPSVILADEPTGNLHTDQGREIMELFTRLHAQGVTIVQVTHSETNAAYGTRVVRLRDGRVDTA